jgi:lycopene cyclase domain-containing protein
MSEYLRILILAGIVPLALSFWPSLRFYHSLKALLFSIASIVCIFGAWDVFAVVRGHWHFNPQAILGLYIFNLPLEEVLFFVVIPFCCIFSWEVVKFFKGKFS